jgi:hypothetical protein
MGLSRPPLADADRGRSEIDVIPSPYRFAPPEPATFKS